MVQRGSVTLGNAGQIPSRPHGWHAGHSQGPWRWWFRSLTAWGAHTVSIPIWTFILPFFVAANIAWRFDHLARRRARLNHCPTCNYDRTGLPAASPCPECWTIPVSSPAANR
jgi:hypothetical protein